MKDFKDPVFLSGSHLDGPLDGSKWKADTEKEVKDDDGETYVFRRVGLSNQAVYCGTKAQCEQNKAAAFGNEAIRALDFRPPCYRS